MSHYISQFANAALSAARSVDQFVTPIGYGVGSVWAFGRDWVVLPSAHYVTAAAVFARPYAASAANYAFAHPVTVGGAGVVLAGTYVAYRLYNTVERQRARLEAAATKAGNEATAAQAEVAKQAAAIKASDVYKDNAAKTAFDEIMNATSKKHQASLASLKAIAPEHETTANTYLAAVTTAADKTDAADKAAAAVTAFNRANPKKTK